MASLTAFTRIPTSYYYQFTPYSESRALRYFSLIGFLVGSFQALCLYLGLQIFPTSIAIILTLLSTTLLTGAFHEDGLADSSDGLGAGKTPQEILRITHDSRLGTYGIIALIFLYSLKFCFLYEWLTLKTPELYELWLLSSLAHVISRSMPTLIARTLPYTPFQTQKKLPYITQNSPTDLTISFMFSLLILICLTFSHGWEIALILLTASLALTWGIRSVLKQKLNGWSGDFLGATQVLTELLIYTLLVSYATLFSSPPSP